MAGSKVELVCDPVELGEGPHWHQESQTLYFVDINGSDIFRYRPSTGEKSKLHLEGGTVSLVLPVEGQPGRFVVSVGRDIVLLEWDGKASTPSHIETLVSLDTPEGARLNDGKADPTGRLWAGTMGQESSPAVVEPGQGALFSFGGCRKATKQFGDVGISNGLAWSSDHSIMYYIDSLALSVDAFDYNIEEGKISNRRKIFDFEKNGLKAFPDGLTIDSEGNLWVACFNGAKVIRVDPRTGQLLTSVDIPALQVTSVCFGGENLDELYVTSANMKLTAEQMKKYPLSGGTFKVTGLGVKGVPGQSVKL